MACLSNKNIFAIPMIQGLRFWLLLSFSIISVLFVSAFLLLSKMYQQAEKFEQGVSSLRDANIKLLESFKIKEDLLINLAGNKDLFFNSDNSIYELGFFEKINQANASLNYIKKDDFRKVEGLISKVGRVTDSIHKYRILFNSSMFLYRKKGFKNYGLEGKMREHAHALIDLKHETIKIFALSLRRHEKDFFLRKETEYLHQFNAVIKALINEVIDNPIYTSNERRVILNHIYYYNKYFNSIARIEKKLGFKNRDGVLYDENNTFENILGLITECEVEITGAYLRKKESIKKTTALLYVSLFSFLLFTVLLFTNLLSNSVKHITGVFSNYVNSGFSLWDTKFKKSNIREFNMIFISFSEMAREINKYTNHFKDIVEARTLEINLQKEEIQNQQNKIESQYQSLLNLFKELENQSRELKLKNDEVQQSLRYAKHIQKALIPKQAEFKKFFSDVFVLSRAKDVISGDFHLAFSLSDNNEIIIATADCTGHGIPGALISMLGINSVQKIVHLMNVNDPGKLLHLVDKDFKTTLNSDLKKHEVYDGMDVAILKFNKSTKQLQYCNAKYHMILIRNGHLLPLEQLKYSIGYSHGTSIPKVFETREIALEEGDSVYLFSDGFADQFGGPFNKKLKKNKLISLLLDNTSSGMKDQKSILKEYFMHWKGKLKQTDDVTVIGLKV